MINTWESRESMLDELLGRYWPHYHWNGALQKFIRFAMEKSTANPLQTRICNGLWPLPFSSSQFCFVTGSNLLHTLQWICNICATSPLQIHYSLQRICNRFYNISVTKSIANLQRTCNGFLISVTNLLQICNISIIVLRQILWWEKMCRKHNGSNFESDLQLILRHNCNRFATA